MFKEYYEKLLQQLSLDFNCTPADLQAKENIGAVDKPTFSRDKRNAKRGFEAYFLYSGNKKGLLT